MEAAMKAMFRTVPFTVGCIVAASCAAGAAQASSCPSNLEWQDRTVDGSVSKVEDTRTDNPRYRVVMVDETTQCRLVGLTDKRCAAGDHVVVTGGRYGVWRGDDRGGEADYNLMNDDKQTWICKPR
jgi:hypothetical protein